MSKNTLNILVVSASSLSLARKIRDEYPGKTVIYCREADNDIEPVTSFKELTGNLFDKSETIVFIGAMGICVRSIAPYIKSKYTDPAVICLDSTGKYVVSVLSGHIGGANELTHELARILDAEAVVTTQSDNQGLWALDTWLGTGCLQPTRRHNQFLPNRFRKDRRGNVQCIEGKGHERMCRPFRQLSTDRPPARYSHEGDGLYEGNLSPARRCLL